METSIFSNERIDEMEKSFCNKADEYSHVVVVGMGPSEKAAGIVLHGGSAAATVLFSFRVAAATNVALKTADLTKA